MVSGMLRSYEPQKFLLRDLQNPNNEVIWAPCVPPTPPVRRSAVRRWRSASVRSARGGSSWRWSWPCFGMFLGMGIS